MPRLPWLCLLFVCSQRVNGKKLTCTSSEPSGRDVRTTVCSRHGSRLSEQTLQNRSWVTGNRQQIGLFAKLIFFIKFLLFLKFPVVHTERNRWRVSGRPRRTRLFYHLHHPDKGFRRLAIRAQGVTKHGPLTVTSISKGFPNGRGKQYETRRRHGRRYRTKQSLPISPSLKRDFPRTIHENGNVK